MPTPWSTIELAVHATVPLTDGQTKSVTNVFNYRLSLAGATQDSGHIAAIFKTAVWDGIRALLQHDYTMVDFTIRDITDVLNPPLVVTATGSGGMTGARASIDLAVSLELGTFTRGRSYRGRKSFGPLDDTTIVGDELEPITAVPAWTAAVASCKSILTDSDGNKWQPVVLSKSLSQLQVNPVSIVQTDVARLVLNTTIGTQRSRRERSQRIPV